MIRGDGAWRLVWRRKTVHTAKTATLLTVTDSCLLVVFTAITIVGKIINRQQSLRAVQMRTM